ncbi:MAG: ABC transporter ATP-binding protein [Alcaligenaceae bacterium]
MTAPSKVLLDIRHISVAATDAQSTTPLVHDVSLQVNSGETLAIVGESGSGKTLTFLAALGIAPNNLKVTSGEVLFQGDDLTKLNPNELRKRRGTAISMVFQDPLSALNPVFSIGTQIIEVLRAHLPLTKAQARARAIELLERVHIPDPARRIDDYPHQFSGGMRQRALIAMAIALEPKVLIADEPTTALDVTVQAQVLELLSELREETGMALVLITHDLGLVARHADRVAVFYAGRVVEQATVQALFHEPRHPYTVSLFRTIPRLDSPTNMALTPISGQPPNLAQLPEGCPFAPRCYLAKPDCGSIQVKLRDTTNHEHLSACQYWPDVQQAS